MLGQGGDITRGGRKEEKWERRFNRMTREEEEEVVVR